MIDIAEKLREAYYGDMTYVPTDVPLLIDAADEIDRLRAALGRIAAYGIITGMGEQGRAERLRDIARAALEDKP